MYSCLHCELISSNRNSFNRHLREHLGTDVTFLRNKIREEEREITNPVAANSSLDQDSSSDVINTNIDGVTTEDISSILERYQHLDNDNIKQIDLNVDHLATDSENTRKENYRQTPSNMKKLKRAKSSYCPECGAGFTQNYHMKLHYKSIHQGIKYPCSQCDYQATQSTHLRSHVKTKHLGIVFECPDCGIKYSDKRRLLKHYSTKHEESLKSV